MRIMMKKQGTGAVPETSFRTTAYNYFDGSSEGAATVGPATAIATNTQPGGLDYRGTGSSFYTSSSHNDYWDISNFWPADQTEMTINFWVKSQSTVTYSNSTDNNSFVINLRVGSNTYNLWNRGSNYYQAGSWTTVPFTPQGVTKLTDTLEWNMLTATKYGSRWKFYINGEQMSTNEQVIADNNLFGVVSFGSYTHIGGNTNPHNTWGWYDDLAVWDFEFDQQQITDLYNGSIDDAITLPATKVPVNLTIADANNNPDTAYNGKQLYIQSSRNIWSVWQNLKAEWIGATTHDAINTSDAASFTIDRESVVYMIRESGWISVPLDGWTLIENNTTAYLTGYGVLQVYRKTLPAGLHVLDNYSAMYIFT